MDLSSERPILSIEAGKKGMCQIELASPSENRKQQLECLAFHANKTENFVSYHFFKPGNKADTWLSFILYPKEKVGIVEIEEGNTKIKRTVSLGELKCYGDKGFTAVNGQWENGQLYFTRFHICSADIPGLKVKGSFNLEL